MYKSANRSMQAVLRKGTRLDHLLRRKTRLRKRLDEAAKAGATAEKAAYEASDRKPKRVKEPQSSN